MIKALQYRSEFLRDCLLARKRSLAKKRQVADAEKEIAEINARLSSPWIFFNSKHTGAKAVGIFTATTMYQNLKTIKKLAIEALSVQKSVDDELVASIQAFRWSDARDGFAAYLYEKSGGSVFLVQRALDHNDIAVTRHYLRQKRMLRQRFDAFRNMTHAILEELRSGQTIDPTVLFLSVNRPEFGSRDRQNLARFRTRMGMGCVSPTCPSEVIAPGHREGANCVVHRCILCRHGVIFTDAYDGLAKRYAELKWLRTNSNPMRWLTSTFSWELDAIELVRDELLTNQIDRFNDLSIVHLMAIEDGEIFVFDDPALRGLLTQ